MAPRSNWKGFLKLSLVSAAIALYPATSASERVRFNTLNKATGNRLRRQMVDSVTGDIVDTEDQVRGYAVSKDAYVVVEDEELDEIAKLAGLPDVIAHGMLTMGLGAGFASSWTGDPGAVTRYAVRLSAPAIVSAKEGADIEFSGRIKSLDAATRSGIILVAAKSENRKIFGLATMNVRFR